MPANSSYYARSVQCLLFYVLLFFFSPSRVLAFLIIVLLLMLLVWVRTRHMTWLSLLWSSAHYVFLTYLLTASKMIPMWCIASYVFLIGWNHKQVAGYNSDIRHSTTRNCILKCSFISITSTQGVDGPALETRDSLHFKALIQLKAESHSDLKRLLLGSLADISF